MRQTQRPDSTAISTATATMLERARHVLELTYQHWQLHEAAATGKKTRRKRRAPQPYTGLRCPLCA
ncbi:hypothetical protein G5B41_11895 [bacterium SGD-2]|nr:hypothetical protein [bacterium SGD-2]